MSQRFLTSMGVLAVVIAVMSLPAVPLAGQAPTAAKTTAAARTTTKAYTPPKTPWGDPDLQGIWNDATSTPLQRPARLGEKGILAEEEADQFAEELAENLNRDRRDGGPEVDVARAYNEHWMDARRLEASKDRRSSLIVDPPDGRLPPAVPPTPEVAKLRAERAAAGARFQAGMPADPEETSLAFRCITRTDAPPYGPGIYNNDFHIVQSPGYVVIAPEMIHSARIIPMDGRPHIGKNLKLWLGDTRGHWEGNTLVVETDNYRPDTGARFTTHLTERFTRVSADRIDYEYTVNDPTQFTKPWTAMVPWNKADGQVFEYACHEGNYDMVHLLGGGRARERAGQTMAYPAPGRGGAQDDDR